jgi:hypothetical protein
MALLRGGGRHEIGFVPTAELRVYATLPERSHACPGEHCSGRGPPWRKHTDCAFVSCAPSDISYRGGYLYLPFREKTASRRNVASNCGPRSLSGRCGPCNKTSSLACSRSLILH